MIVGMLNPFRIPQLSTLTRCFDMVSRLSYSVHAAQGDICLLFAEFFVSESTKLIEIIVMLSVRLYFFKGAFLEVAPPCIIHEGIP